MNNYLIEKWGLQPVRRCCKGSQLARVAPAKGIQMKITKAYLKEIIKEEIHSYISESQKVAKRRADNAVKFIKAHGNEAKVIKVGDGVFKIEATKVIFDTKTGESKEETEIIEPTRTAVRDFLEY